MTRSFCLEFVDAKGVPGEYRGTAPTFTEWIDPIIVALV
jgi:hypothetical protein